MRTSRSLAVLAGAALALGPALPAAADHDVTPARIGGDTRYGTAAEIAHAQYPDGASEVIVASGTRFPDALAGAPVAAELDAPILLTERDDVPDATLAALDELDPDHVTILGGTVAVSEAAEARIAQSVRVEVDRIEGQTRYDTAAQAARFVQERNDNAANWPGGQRAAFLTTGENFPDALSAGAPAASRDEAPIPILLTHENELPAATAQTIEELNLDLVVVVGGTGAVAQSVEDAVNDDDTTTDRVAGETRTATATEMADYAIQYLGFDEDDITLTRGDLFPDALAVAPMTGANHNPILLTENSTELSAPTGTWLAEQCGAIDRIRGVGQEAALSTEVLNDAEQAAEDCHGEGTDQTFTVEPQEQISTSPGEAREFEAVRTYDGTDISQPLDVALLPCGTVEEPSDGEFRFADGNDDGFADGIESTDTGEAVITAYENDDVADVKAVRGVEPGGDEAGIQVTVTSDAEDCAAIVFYDDANDNDELDVGDDGLPTEQWGFGLIDWSS